MQLRLFLTRQLVDAVCSFTRDAFFLSNFGKSTYQNNNIIYTLNNNTNFNFYFKKKKLGTNLTHRCARVSAWYSGCPTLSRLAVPGALHRHGL